MTRYTRYVLRPHLSLTDRPVYVARRSTSTPSRHRCRIRSPELPEMAHIPFRTLEGGESVENDFDYNIAHTKHIGLLG